MTMERHFGKWIFFVYYLSQRRAHFFLPQLSPPSLSLPPVSAAMQEATPMFKKCRCAKPAQPDLLSPTSVPKNGPIVFPAVVILMFPMSTSLRVSTRTV